MPRRRGAQHQPHERHDGNVTRHGEKCHIPAIQGIHAAAPFCQNGSCAVEKRLASADRPPILTALPPAATSVISPRSPGTFRTPMAPAHGLTSPRPGSKVNGWILPCRPHPVLRLGLGMETTRSSRLAALYAGTIFVSAFLLFQIQPLISRFILPWFGGTPAVWTTCLVFFQTMLFGGYATPI